MNHEPATVPAAAIAKKNDELRSMLPYLPYPHKFVMSDEVACLETEKLSAIINRVKTFSDFNDENDPHHEHDCASFAYEDKTIIWKFDYYDKNLEFFEENGIRVLIIMFSHEY